MNKEKIKSKSMREKSNGAELFQEFFFIQGISI